MLNEGKSLNSLAKEMRLSLGLEKQELAELAEVSEVEVDSFECSLPVSLGSRNKILNVLYKNLKYHMMGTK